MLIDADNAQPAVIEALLTAVAALTAVTAGSPRTAPSATPVRQYELGVVFRLGRLRGARAPGLRLIIPFADVMHKVSLRIVTAPIQSQGIITRDNVSVDVSAVASYRVVDAVKSVLAIENVRAAIDQIAQTTLRKAVGQHTLDQTLSTSQPPGMPIHTAMSGWVPRLVPGKPMTEDGYRPAADPGVRRSLRTRRATDPEHVRVFTGLSRGIFMSMASANGLTAQLLTPGQGYGG